ncbi:MAG: RNA polymerase sigma factor RpoD/SigA [Candidatus Poribacteria bacterium]
MVPMSNDEFIEIPYLDDATLDLDETLDDTTNILSSAASYIKKAGQTPLLKPDEEKTLFEKLQIQKTLLKKFLFQLQDSNLLNAEQREVLEQLFRFKRRSAKNSQMNISPETLGKLQDLIDDWKTDIAIGVPNKHDDQNNVFQREEYGREHALSAFIGAVLAELQSVLERIQDIQQRLVKANLLLVVSIAKQFTFCESPLSFLDLVQEGNIGLMTAIHKFRLEKGHRFSTYATWWISQAMRRALEEQGQLIRLPSYIIEARRRATHASIDLTKRLGREPKLDELAEAINITKSKLYNILQAPKDLLSLDYPIEESDNKATVADLIGDDTAISPEEKIMSQARQEIVEKLLSTLSPQQARVIKLRYGLFDDNDHTLAQIGAKLKITRERVRQIELEAIKKLRHPTRLHYWEELLD